MCAFAFWGQLAPNIAPIRAPYMLFKRGTYHMHTHTHTHTCGVVPCKQERHSFVVDEIPVDRLITSTGARARGEMCVCACLGEGGGWGNKPVLHEERETLIERAPTSASHASREAAHAQEIWPEPPAPFACRFPVKNRTDEKCGIDSAPINAHGRSAHKNACERLQADVGVGIPLRSFSRRGSLR